MPQVWPYQNSVPEITSGTADIPTQWLRDLPLVPSDFLAKGAYKSGATVVTGVVARQFKFFEAKEPHPIPFNVQMTTTNTQPKISSKEVSYETLISDVYIKLIPKSSFKVNATIGKIQRAVFRVREPELEY